MGCTAKTITWGNNLDEYMHACGTNQTSFEVFTHIIFPMIDFRQENVHVEWRIVVFLTTNR